MPNASRPLPWVASTVYLAVLATGIFYDLAGLAAPVSLAGFVAVLLALLGLELVERRQVAPRPSRWLAVALLLARMALFEVVNALDGAGFSRALYLLIPFSAYFLFGRWVSYGLAAGYLTAAGLRLAFVPGWSGDAERVSDLLMFFIGMIFAVSMAAVAAGAQASQARAERLFDELGATHRRLVAYAEQVAELATATERNRLARDIHDSLGHHLTAIAVQLEKAEVFRERDPVAANRALADARGSLAQALRDVRRSVGALRAEPFSLSAAVNALADGLRTDDLRITLEVDGDEAAHPPSALMTLYRAAQEGLTNAYRHGQAREVHLTISLGPAEAVMHVADDGRGFDVEQAVRIGGSAGNGLRGMSERVALVGGAMQVDAGPGRGTRLTVRVPRSQVPAP